MILCLPTIKALLEVPPNPNDEDLKCFAIHNLKLQLRQVLSFFHMFIHSCVYACLCLAGAADFYLLLLVEWKGGNLYELCYRLGTGLV